MGFSFNPNNLSSKSFKIDSIWSNNAKFQYIFYPNKFALSHCKSLEQNFSFIHYVLLYFTNSIRCLLAYTIYYLFFWLFFPLPSQLSLNSNHHNIPSLNKFFHIMF
jgi:hypothetical protein